MNIKILDCTIRDGGHLNNWEFDPSCVKAAYSAALKSGVDYFEVGYRFPETKKGHGKFGYCSDEYIKSLLEIDDRCKLLVMVDAGRSENVIFKECTGGNTLIKGVRVASYPYEYEKALSFVEKLNGLGYEVFLNLMAASEITEDQYKILKNWKPKDLLQAVNFADSFGSFIPSDISVFFKKLKSTGFESIGFHSHNNLQMAFANSLKAIEEGATFLDASIFGMGRGSGNLPIEIILGYLEKAGNSKYNTVPYLDVIDRYFNDIFKKYDWGYKLKSLIGGLKNLHPYYVDELFERKSFTVPEIWNATDYIKESCPTSFSRDELDKKLSQRFFNPLTPEKANEMLNLVSDQFKLIQASDAFKLNHFGLHNKHKGEKILVIANGPSILTYKNEIDRLITDEKVITIGVNFLRELFIPTYHMFISRKRLLKYIDRINPNSTLLVPSFFGKELLAENYSGKISYFDIDTVNNKDTAVVEKTTQKCLHLNVSISAILTAYLMGASEIYAVGIDGYIDEINRKMVFFYNEDDTPDEKGIASLRYEMFAEELDRVSKFLLEKSVSFSIITPTSHKKYYRNIFKI